MFTCKIKRSILITDNREITLFFTCNREIIGMCIVYML